MSTDYNKVGRMSWVSVHMVFLEEILLMKIEIKLQEISLVNLKASYISN